MKKIILSLVMLGLIVSMTYAQDVLVIDKKRTDLTVEKQSEIYSYIEEYLRYMYVNSDPSEDLNFVIENFYSLDKEIYINTEFNEISVEWNNGEDFVSFSYCDELIKEIIPIVKRVDKKITL